MSPLGLIAFQTLEESPKGLTLIFRLAKSALLAPLLLHYRHGVTHDFSLLTLLEFGCNHLRLAFLSFFGLFEIAHS